MSIGHVKKKDFFFLCVQVFQYVCIHVPASILILIYVLNFLPGGTRE